MVDRMMDFLLCTLAIAAGLRLYDWLKARLHDGRQ